MSESIAENPVKEEVKEVNESAEEAGSENKRGRGGGRGRRNRRGRGRRNRRGGANPKDAGDKPEAESEENSGSAPVRGDGKRGGRGRGGRGGRRARKPRTFDNGGKRLTVEEWCDDAAPAAYPFEIFVSMHGKNKATFKGKKVKSELVPDYKEDTFNKNKELLEKKEDWPWRNHVKVKLTEPIMVQIPGRPEDYYPVSTLSCFEYVEGPLGFDVNEVLGKADFSNAMSCSVNMEDRRTPEKRRISAWTLVDVDNYTVQIGGHAYANYQDDDFVLTEGGHAYVNSFVGGDGTLTEDQKNQIFTFFESKLNDELRKEIAGLTRRKPLYVHKDDSSNEHRIPVQKKN